MNGVDAVRECPAGFDVLTVTVGWHVDVDDVEFVLKHRDVYVPEGVIEEDAVHEDERRIVLRSGLVDGKFAEIRGDVHDFSVASLDVE